MFRTFFQQNARSLLALLLLVVLPLLVDAALTKWLFQQGSMYLAGLSSVQMLGYFAVTAVLMGLGLAHTTFVALVSGYFLGWEGFAGTVAAYGLAAALGYRVASLIDHGALRRFVRIFPKAEAVLSELQTESLPLIVLVRLSPVLPFALMTFVLAALQVNFQRFIMGSVLGMLPRTLFVYWLGTRAAGLMELLNHPDRTSAGQWLVVALVLGSGVGLYLLIMRAVRTSLARLATPGAGPEARENQEA